MTTPPATTPPPASTPPPPPVPAPVALTQVNTLNSSNVISMHMWQEYHWKAPTNVYKGHADDDKKVAEITNDDDALVPKQFINMGFCEWAMATIEADVPAGQELYLRWWIEDMNGTVIREHEDFTKANFDSKNAKAKLAAGKYAWHWDGRTKNANGRMNFVPTDMPYWSRVQVKNKDGIAIATAPNEVAIIRARGEPYHVFSISVPKNDSELESEMTGRCGGRWLGTDGARMATDCWIKIYRGVAAPGDDGHIVFLGHGAVEATEVTTASGGAVATPHDRDHRVYIRKGTHGGIEFNLCELADENVTPQTYYKITLIQAAGMPPPINPYAGPPVGAYKDGVHCHQSFTSGGTNFLIHNASVGCSTFKDLSAKTEADPAARVGDVLNIKASVGHWNGAAPVDSNNTLWGPPMDGGRPNTFLNKQNKRDAVSDAAIPDDHENPVLQPPVPGSTTTPPETTEPLHMQSTAQRAIYGGLLQCEVPWWSIKQEPDKEPNRQMRIRCRLTNAAENTRYWQYHRLAVFGHTATVSGKNASFDLWIPKMVQRMWNGQVRNLGLTGLVKYQWYFEERKPDGTTVNRGRIGAEATSGTAWTALASGNIGHYTRPATALPTVDDLPENHGTEMYSVFRYRIDIRPQPAPNVHVWEPLTACEDLFTPVFARARLLDEQIVVEGGTSYLIGQSELKLPVIDTPLPNLPPGAPSPGMPQPPGRGVPE